MIREPNPGEAHAVAAVQLAGWRETYSQLLPARFFDDASRARLEGMWTRIVASPEDGRQHRVAVVDGSIVGLALSRLSAPGQRDLLMLYLLAAHHGSGLGQHLLDAVLGAERTTLWMAEDNPRARAFYVRNGFRRTGARRLDAHFDDLPEIELAREPGWNNFAGGGVR